MNLPGEEEFAVRRGQLAEQIARQRTQLAAAYLDLEKPIRYTEYGMKGFGFIRQNPWILTLTPALLGSLPSIFNLVSSALGWGKKKKIVPVQRQFPSPETVPPTATKKISRVSNALMTGVEHGLRAYNLYRRVRSLIP